MKICIAQTSPNKGDIARNIEQHVVLLNMAIAQHADVVFFPELSLTGYEPTLAPELATTQEDKRLDIFQEISDRTKIVIGVGLPTNENDQLFISIIIFQPNKERLTYSKQYLYHTEVGIFTAGTEQLYLNVENNIVAPAICYELSNPEHSEQAYKNNANIYIASVLNSVTGVDGDIQKLSTIAAKYNMTTFLANYVGTSGGYQCAGKSSVWNKEGQLIGQLDDKNEGVLIYDTETQGIKTEIR
jgi:predicted amidohydrolase